MKRVPLSEVKDDLSRYVQLAAHEEIVVTRHGRPAAVLIGFADEGDWFDYQLEHDPRFVARMESARRSLETGQGISIEEVRTQLDAGGKSRPQRTTSGRRAAAPKRPTRKKPSR
jgi:prevent-host-death family protein